MIGLICLAFSFVFALLASFGVGNIGKLNLGWLSVAFLALGHLLMGVRLP